MALPTDIPSQVIPLEAKIPAFDQDSFSFKAINANLWNSFQPYQFVILVDKGNEEYEITPYSFTLPIPPQELSISMPVADTLAATLTGYNEVHGGAPFRHIMAAGTTGVIPEAVTGVGRATVATGTQTGSQFGASIGSQIQQIGDALGGNRVANEYPIGTVPPKGMAPVNGNDFPVWNTGYYYFHQMRQFLEGYLALKGRGENLNSGQTDNDSPTSTYTGTPLDPKTLRLAFCVWKDSAVYLVKLQNFEMRRSLDSALEYRYQLQMQAFKRINLKARGASAGTANITLPKKTVIQSALNAIDGARKVIAGVGNLVNLGILGALTTISELGRQVSGAIKDIAAISRNIVDMPTTFQNAVLNEVLSDYVAAMAGAQDVKLAATQFGASSPALNAAIENRLAATGYGRHGPPTAGSPLRPVTQAETQVIVQPSSGPAARVLISGDRSAGGQGGVGTTFLDTTSTNLTAFNNTGIDPQDLISDVPEIGDISLATLPLSDDQRAQLDAERKRSLAMTTIDFETIRDQMQQAVDNYMAFIGSWDQVYVDTYGLSQPTTPRRDPTREEQDILFSVAQMIQQVDNFIVVLRNQGGQQQPTPSGIEYMSQLAQQSGIDFRVPRSKYAITLPFGYSLERVASQYLGDPNRWIEIAALNELQSPYVDETGFDLFLVTNGSGSEIVVPQSNDIFIGQRVSLASDAVNPETHTIVNIEPNDDTTVLVSLDGAPTLERFTVAEQARLHAYLPGTVNSQQLIYLPNGGIPTIDPGLDQIPNVDIKDPFILAGGVDWLLTPARDLVVTSAGDNPLAFGLTSVVQLATVAFSTPKGSLLYHKNWGFGPLVGASSADVDPKQIFEDLQQFFSGDPIIAGLQSAFVQKKGDSLFINATIGVKGYDRGIPVLLQLGATR